MADIIDGEGNVKRDMELCRKVLEQIEEKFPNVSASLEIDGRTEEEIAYHIILLAEAGFIEADIYQNDLGIPLATPKRMKWPGHEFLDAIRNDTVWNKIKETVKEKGGAIPFEVLKTLAVQFAGNIFGVGT